MRPQGELTPERYSQWQDALDTLAKKKVTEAEGATVVNALKSWAELRAYMEQKDRLFPPDTLIFMAFCKAHKWTLQGISLFEMVLETWSLAVGLQ